MTLRIILTNNEEPIVFEDIEQSISGINVSESPFSSYQTLLLTNNPDFANGITVTDITSENILKDIWDQCFKNINDYNEIESLDILDNNVSIFSLIGSQIFNIHYNYFILTGAININIEFN